MMETLMQKHIYRSRRSKLVYFRVPWAGLLCAALLDAHWSSLYTWTNAVALFRLRPIGVRVCQADPRRGSRESSGPSASPPPCGRAVQV
jgi:hypothetical protein